MIRGTHASTAQYKRHVLYDKILNGAEFHGSGISPLYSLNPSIAYAVNGLRGLVNGYPFNAGLSCE